MPNSKSWLQNNFLEYLKNHPLAERAINNLVTESCSRGKLILILRTASDPSRKQIWNHFAREWTPSRQHAIGVARILDQASAELRRFACSPFGAAALVYHETLEGALRGEPGVQNKAEDPRALADAMERQAHSLLQYSDSPVAALTQRMLSFRTIWKHLPIAFAVGVVRRRKGRVPWGDVAYALEAVAAGYGIKAEISPDALRKQHNGFIRSSAGKAFHKSGASDVLLRVLFPPS
jgi:hypothetical protein